MGGFQLTTLTTCIGIIAMLAAWVLVGQRIRQSQAAVLRPVRLLNRTFFFMAVFFLFMATPSIWLTFDPARFPSAMAWGYVIGHIFLYIAFINIGSMIVAMIPRLAGREWLVKVVGSVALVAVTIFNAITMIWGTQPSYNYQEHVTQFNANPLVGAAIGIMACLTFLPAGVLFLRNAFRTEGSRRTRSLLLGIGFLVMTVAGPPHDVAGNWQTYMFGDILVIIAVILVACGVVYRLEQSLTLDANASPSSSATPPAAV